MTQGKKFVTTSAVNLDYKSPQEVPVKKKPFVFSTNDIEDPGPDSRPLRKVKDLKLFDPIINRTVNHRMANFGMTTGDLPSDLSELKEKLRLPCGERPSLRMASIKEKVDLQEVQEIQDIQEVESIIPWMDPEGNFRVLDPDVYKTLVTEEKRAYNLAKGRESRKKKNK